MSERRPCCVGRDHPATRILLVKRNGSTYSEPRCDAHDPEDGVVLSDKRYS